MPHDELCRKYGASKARPYRWKSQYDGMTPSEVRRRKLSSDSPTFTMRDGKLWVALSTPGGHTINQTSAQMVINLIDFDMDIQAAISAPRIAFNVPDHLEVEASIPAETQRAPREMGHKVRTRSLGNAHRLMIEYDEQGKPVRFLGGTDPRGTGQAEGY